VAPEEAAILFKTTILPVALYGWELWWKGESPRTKKGVLSKGREQEHLASSLDKIIVRAARHIFPFHKGSPKVAAFREMQIPPTRLLLEGLRLKASLRLKLQDDDHPLRRRLQVPTRIPKGRKRKTAGVEYVGSSLHTLEAATKFDSTVFANDLEARKISRTEALQITPTTHKYTAAKQHVRNLGDKSGTTLIYTDGSLRQDTRAGWGAVAYHRGKVKWEIYGPFAGGTIYDIETYALDEATKAALQETGPVSFFSDNAGLVNALQGGGPLSSGWKISKIRARLQRKGWTCEWVPGHQGIQGNEHADAIAKIGAAMEHSGDKEYTPRGALAEIKKEIREAAEQWWKNESPPGYRALGIGFWRPKRKQKPQLGTVHWNFRATSPLTREWWKTTLEERTEWGFYQATLDKMNIRAEARCETCDEPRVLRHFQGCGKWKEKVALVLALSGRGQGGLAEALFGQWAENMEAGLSSLDQ